VGVRAPSLNVSRLAAAIDAEAAGIEVRDDAADKFAGTRPDGRWR
jgi:hypothetical protein